MARSLVPLCVAGVLVALAVAALGPTSKPAPRSAGARLSERSTSTLRSEISPFVSGPGAVTVAGTGAPGFSGDDGAASVAELDEPGGIAEDNEGDLFIADTGNCRVREVPAHSGTQFSIQMDAGQIYTIAGGACGTSSDRIGFVSDVALDSGGDLFMTDPSGDTVLELPATSGEQFGIVMTAGKLIVVAGTGAPSEKLDDPQGIGLDPQGDLLIADTADCEVRELASHDGTQWDIAMVTGHIYTIAGTGSCGQFDDGGIATSAELWDPVDVAAGPAGDVLVSDAGAEEVMDLASRTGDYYGVPIRADHLAVVAGFGSYGPYLIDGFSATGQTAGLDSPSDIAVTQTGDLLIADAYSSAIREVPTENESERGISLIKGDMYTVSGALPTGPGGASTNWVGAEMLYPAGVAVAPDGMVVYSDEGANVVRELSVRG